MPTTVNGVKIAVHAAELDELPDRILARPFAFGERSAHDRDVLCARSVAALEHAAAQQRDVGCGEVFLACDTELGIAGARWIERSREEFVDRGDLVALAQIYERPARRWVPRERRKRDAARCFDPRQGSQPFDHLFVKARARRPILSVARRGRATLMSNRPSVSKARIHADEMLEAASEEDAADHQYESHGDLPRNETLAQP